MYTLDGMSYVYVYIYTLCTGASVRVRIRSIRERKACVRVGRACSKVKE